MYRGAGKKRKTAIERVRKKQEGEGERREEDGRRQRRLVRVVRNSAETRETVSWRDNSACAREKGEELAVGNFRRRGVRERILCRTRHLAVYSNERERRVGCGVRPTDGDL